MFMRHNRALNGAPQPEAVASATASQQASQAVLSPNPSLEAPQHRIFQPELSSVGDISRRHKAPSVSGEGYDWASYESHLPLGPSL
jgi:hypothetical protein